MQQDFTLNGYDFDLPEKNIAQTPADKRDNSKLLVVQRKASSTEHKLFADIIDYILPGDLLIVNDTKVFPARLLGKKETGGKAEIFLLEYPALEPTNDTDNFNSAFAPVLIKSSKRPKIGSTILISDKLHCSIVDYLDGGKVQIELRYDKNDNLAELLDRNGQVPLPPYISRDGGTTKSDKERYQTVYANNPGAVAAPTAGLHFTQELLQKLRDKNVNCASVTLHVGYGTFAPVREEDITKHEIHKEYISVSREVSKQIKQTKKDGGKVWAVGTTTVRALEFAATKNELSNGFEGWCDLYIMPGFEFKVIDHLITNFHLPQSSLLFLVSALCGRENLLGHYQEAIKEGYRFYSYGDAMAII